jgi:acyl dehydratase
MAGRYFDEWQMGDRIEHPITRTVTETDNLLISTLTHNPQPLHLDVTYAEASEFGQIVVNGLFTFALMVGLSIQDTTLGTLIANLSHDKVIMPKPVFIGDTLRCETTVLSIRPSTSRPGHRRGGADPRPRGFGRTRPETSGPRARCQFAGSGHCCRALGAG